MILLVIPLLLLIQTTVASNGDCNAAGSGYECGWHNGYPIFTVLRFNTQNCQTAAGSMHFSYNNGYTKVNRFTDTDRSCSDGFGYFYGSSEFVDLFFGASITIANEQTCTGTYNVDALAFADEFETLSFQDAKLLCNNGEVQALLLRQDGGQFVLYYETDAIHDPCYSQKDHYCFSFISIATAGVPESNGEYCTNIYELMNKLLPLLKSGGFDDLPSACSTGGTNIHEWGGSENSGLLIGAVVAGSLVLILIVVVVIWWHKKNEKKKKSNADEVGYDGGVYGDTPPSFVVGGEEEGPRPVIVASGMKKSPQTRVGIDGKNAICLSQIAEESIFAGQGLREGMVVRAINGTPVKTVEQASSLTRNYTGMLTIEAELPEAQAAAF